MKFTNIEIRACKHTPNTDLTLKDGRPMSFEFLVLKFETDEGLSCETFGFAGRSSLAIGEVSSQMIKPFFIGRDTRYREKNWHDFRKYNRAWNLSQNYCFAPYDIASWLVQSISANLPLYQFIGAMRDSIPIYGSSMTLKTADDYAKEALDLKKRGWAAYKLHPPLDYEITIEAHKACREAVGSNFRLMSDPVNNFSYNQNLHFGKLLEDLDYYWLEEPMYDEFHGSLKSLKEKLKIPIVGGETAENHPEGVAHLISDRAVDIVRGDISWSGGITGLLKTAHLAEAHGMNCEIHTAIYHPLELVNLHCASAIKNTEFFEVLLPEHLFNIGLKEKINIKDGHAYVPKNKPGLGIDLDWDFIDNSTLKVFDE
jgi:L-alanine-DL-glutamate epimerase-like enolase superfamily enzyme